MRLSLLALLLAVPALAADPPAKPRKIKAEVKVDANPLLGTWVRDLPDMRVVLKFAEKRLFVTLQTAGEPGKTMSQPLCVKLDADYAVGPDGRVFGVVTGIDLSGPEVMEWATRRFEQSAIDGTPFAARARIDDETLTVSGLRAEGMKDFAEAVALLGKFRRAGDQPLTELKPAKSDASREEAPTPRGVSIGTEQDNRLADEVSKKLEGDSATAGAGLRVSANDGTVTLIGTVESDSKKAAILETVRYMPGVKRVRDGLEVSAVEQVPSRKPTTVRELATRLWGPKPVAQFMCVVESGVQYLPDITKSGEKVGALLCKAFLFDAGSKPTEADGQLTVVMTDTTPRSPGTPPKNIEVTNFDAATLKKLLANDERLGRHYLFPIQWPTDWTDVTQVTIQAQYKPNPESKLPTLYHPAIKVSVKVGKE